MKKVQARRVISIVILVFLLTSTAAFYRGLTVKRYVLYSDKINQPIRLLLITDLHSHVYGKDQQPLIQKVRQQKPDIILLAGDIVDDVVPIEGATLFLKGIQNAAPVYYVTGNHEYWSYRIQEIRDILESFQVKILSDTFETIEIKGNELLIAGAEDPDKAIYEDKTYNPDQSMAQAFSTWTNLSGYKIFLAHRPERIGEYKKYTADLVVSGHAHGGQVRIPFLVNGLYAPNQGWFPAYAGGLYTHEALTHIVSRGVSFNPRLPRVFNPPEIVVIDII